MAIGPSQGTDNRQKGFHPSQNSEAIHLQDLSTDAFPTGKFPPWTQMMQRC